MSDRGFDQLFILNRKLDELLIRYNNLKKECRELKDDLEAMKLKLHHREEEIKELKVKYERVKLSGALLGEGENAGEARRKITELVREIDRCVALLNR